jgi:predicted metal-dependent phosphoesterase TrpH
MKYDLHIHTNYSKCSNNKPQTILKIAKKRGLDGIAITDHQQVKGAFKVKELNKDNGFEVIIGEEIATNYGDVLVYYLKEKIKSFDFDDVVKEARKQNALVVIPHPFRTTLVHDHKFQVPLAEVKDKIDAIECFNARILLSSDNKKANDAANKLNIAKTAGSDSHFFFEIGTARTIFDGDLRTALKKRQTKVQGTIKVGSFGGALSFLRKKFL